MRFPTQELQLKAERKGTAYLVITTVFKCGGQGGTSSIACFTFYSSDGFMVCSKWKCSLQKVTAGLLFQF